MKKTSRLRENKSYAVFIIPALLIILFSQTFPVLYSIQLSFREWSLAVSQAPQGFVGLKNYISAFSDEVFIHALKISVIFCIFATLFELILGFILAYFTVGESFVLRIVRTILILPMVIAPVANGTIWRMILNSRYGLLNSVLNLLGIESLNWLGTPDLALVSVIGIDIWQWTPFAMVVFIAGFSVIPTELYDAAEVDGAGRFRILRSIIIPSLIPMILIVLLFRIVETFLVIDAIYTTTFGGPGFSTQTVTLFIYWQSLRYFNLSYAAATSWIISVITLFIAFLILKWQQKKQFTF
jgi:ABC-type sugar transport system permease subunit